MRAVINTLRNARTPVGVPVRSARQIGLRAVRDALASKSGS